MNKELQLKRVAQAKLPTPFGEFLMVGFEEIATGHDHVALVFGDISGDEPVLSRVHSECLTGDALFSLRCDCGFQLEAALKQISEEGRGVLLYHRQEGRNIGLLNKIRAYALQDTGLDTVEANQKLGFALDERDFTLCADMYKLLDVHAIRLLTNNPEKVEILTQARINITERVPLIVGRNPANAHYLDTKAEKMGHMLCQSPAVITDPPAKVSKNRKARQMPRFVFTCLNTLRQHLPDHIAEDAAVAVIFQLRLCVDTAQRIQFSHTSVRMCDFHRYNLFWCDAVQAADVNQFIPGQPQRTAIGSRRKLQRQDTHTNQVRTVDPLIGFRQHHSHPQKISAFRCPVTAGAGAVLFLAITTSGVPDS